MIKDKSFLAIIPARAGSKRLPNKNIRPLLNKPLVAWTIEAAMASRHIDEVIVTTDDQIILDIAKRYGVEAPFLRPDFLASDTATSFDVIKHTIDYYNQKGRSFDYVILLQPTSPLRTEKHIDGAISFLSNKNADAVISVTEMPHSHLWANSIPENKDMSHFLDESLKNKRSQDLEKSYTLNGAIYICETQKLIREKSFFLKEKIFAYCMDKNVSIDVDDRFDFDLCQFLLEMKKK